MAGRIIGWVFFCFCVNVLAAQQIDTSAVKLHIESLSSFAAKKQFLINIYDEDQKYRGPQTNDSLDYIHLIAVSFYVNAFGYPAEKDFGQYAAAPWLVWVHQKYSEIDKISFPVIRNGFLSGQIKEYDLRTYFLRTLYQRKFDDAGYKTMPLKDLFKVCDVHITNKIAIAQIIQKQAEINLFNQLEIKNISQWKVEDKVKSYSYNNKPVTTKLEGPTIKLFEMADNKKYLLHVYADGSGEPIEIVYINDTCFKYKYQKTDKYFEFIQNKLIYKNGKEVIEVYELVAANNIRSLVPGKNH